MGMGDCSEWENYESGPYCQHWSDPWNCDELCKCGHYCREHGDGSCNADGCKCEEFEDPT